MRSILSTISGTGYRKIRVRSNHDTVVTTGQNSVAKYRYYHMSADSTVHVLSLSRECPDFPENPVRCLFAVPILSGFLEKRCPFYVCPVRQGRDRDVRTFGVLVRRRLAIMNYYRL